MKTVRLIHYSDVHLTSPKYAWRPRDFVSKRMLGYVNIRFFGRGRRFRLAPTVVNALTARIRQGNYDQGIFSGDATKLAFESEFAFAAESLGVNDPTIPPTLTIPGNHDYYTRRTVRLGHFEKYFAPWLLGQRIDDHIYPFARKVGHVWLIALNSSHPQRFNLGASGTIGQGQLHRLERLCQTLDEGPRILVTHYPLRTAKRQIEVRSHRLLDHAKAIQTAIKCQIRLWLHGHIHRAFYLTPDAEIPFHVICAGSATQTDRWSHNDYEIIGDQVNVTRWQYQAEAHDFERIEDYTFTLAGS